jgi:L-alanine-DL-glutamate epimerase-like enolase superfamily enzyme
MADEAEVIHRAHGIEAFKVKGGTSAADDLEAIRLIRERLGPAAQLSLDPNEGYSPKEAVRVLARMADQGVAYVEEPIPRSDRRRVDVARAIPMPILADDSCMTLQDVVRELDIGAIGMISIKTPRTGFWESGRIAILAEAYGLPCVVGTAVGGALSSLAALHFSCSAASLALPSENSFGLNLVTDIVENAPAVAGGRLELPEGPGLGAVVSETTLAQVRVDAGGSR